MKYRVVGKRESLKRAMHTECPTVLPSASSCLLAAPLVLDNRPNLNHDLYPHRNGKILEGWNVRQSTSEVERPTTSLDPSKCPADHQQLSLPEKLEHGYIIPLQEPKKTSSGLRFEQYTQLNAALPRAIQNCVHHQISERAKSQPQAQAICSRDGNTLTYEELETQSSRLARQLYVLGVLQGDHVGFCFEKSLWAIVSILAILKAGGACVALDASHPRQRLQAIIKLANISLILTSAANAHLFRQSDVGVVEIPASLAKGPGLDNAELDVFKNPSKPDSSAFVVFTSGSSGAPKGVVLDHNAVCTSAYYHGEAMGVDLNSRVLQYAPYTFDMSIYDIITTLIRGGCVCVISESDRLHDLPGAFCDVKANWAFFTPSMLAVLHPQDLIGLQILLLAGEPVGKEIIEKWADKVRLINGYGSTECSTCVIGNLSIGSEPNLIGKPVGVRYWLVDPDDTNILLPPDEPGELLVQGPVLARCYLSNDRESEAKFINAPTWLREKFPTDCSKVYRTGDIVKISKDGNLVFLGRQGNMVKIRGQRVELEEIEQQLTQHASIEHALVSFPKGGHYAQSLIAIMTIKGPRKLESESSSHIKEVSEACLSTHGFDKQLIRQHLLGVLPHYMVPDVFVVLERMPFTSSGKIDRLCITDWLSTLYKNPRQVADLPDPVQNSLPLRQQVLAKLKALSPNEHTKELLSAPGLSEIPLFLAGFDSIRLIELSSFIKNSFGIRLTSSVLGSMKLQQIVLIIERHQTGDIQSSNPSPRPDVVAEFNSLRNQLNNTPPDERSKLRTIFLTGCTGFLGIHLLDHLLRRFSDATITILVRASKSEHALQRLLERAKRRNVDIESCMHRLHVWTGNLGLGRLGLTSEQWDHLSGANSDQPHFDAVIHNGAMVHWTMDYESLRDVNVLSTLQLIQACQLSKYCPRFVYVSGGQIWRATETDDIETAVDVNRMSGYDLSKLMSEFLVKAFAKETKMTTPLIVRPGFIIGDMERGEAMTDDFIWRIVAGSVGAGKFVEEEEEAWLYICGVDKVAEAISESLHCDRNIDGLNYAVKNVTDGLRVVDFWAVIREFGYQVDPIPGAEWLNTVSEQMERTGPSHPLWPVREILESNGAALGVPRVEREEPTVLSMQRVRQTLQRNVEYLQQTRYLPDPKGELPVKKVAWQGFTQLQEGTLLERTKGGRRNGFHHS